jgi:hypothetical protein
MEGDVRLVELPLCFPDELLLGLSVLGQAFRSSPGRTRPGKNESDEAAQKEVPRIKGEAFGHIPATPKILTSQRSKGRST